MKTPSDNMLVLSGILVLVFFGFWLKMEDYNFLELNPFGNELRMKPYSEFGKPLTTISRSKNAALEIHFTSSSSNLRAKFEPYNNLIPYSNLNVGLTKLRDSGRSTTITPKEYKTVQKIDPLPVCLADKGLSRNKFRSFN